MKERAEAPSAAPLTGGRYILIGEPITRTLTRVHKGYDTHGEFGEVAIKLLPDAGGDYYAITYDREVTSLERLKHPNVVPLLDHGTDEATGRPYLVFPWLERRLQDEMSGRGEMSWSVWWHDFGRPILEGLDAAHRLEIHHRDLKPANVLIGADGAALIIDFGISKIESRARSQDATVDGASPPFTPRELVTDSPGMTRDTHAWAALTVFAVSGIDPYPTEPADPWDLLELARQKAGPGLPPRVRAVVDRCLSRDPKSRPLNAAILMAELEAAIAREASANSQSGDGAVVWVVLRDGVAQNLQDAFELVAADVDDLLTSELRGPVYVVDTRDKARYLLITATLSLKVAIHPDGHAVIATSVASPPASVLDRDRDRGLAAPFRFSLAPRGAQPDRELESARTTIRDLIQAIEEHRLETRKAGPTERARPFVVWRALLSLLKAYEADNEEPIRYVDARPTRRGRVEFELHREVADSTLIGDVRVAVAAGARDFSGTVVSAQGTSVVIEPDVGSADMPLTTGTLRRDRRASQSAIDKQQRALDAVEYGRGVRPDLPELLADPRIAASPRLIEDLDYRLDLDEPKKKAIAAALGTSDILLVQGPPGTGKTTFITELVLQEFERNPDCRILLSSQSHAALDHALAQIAREEGSLELVRIAKDEDERVSEGSRVLMLDYLVAQWRAEAVRSGRRWLREWAQAIEVDVVAIETALHLADLAAELRRHTSIEQRRTDLEKAVEGMRNARRNAAQGSTVAETMRERLVELTELTGQLEVSADRVKEQMGRLVELGRLTKRTSRRSLSADALDAEAKTLLPDDAASVQIAQRVLALLSDWHARFGVGAAFRAALLAKAQVVAATCVGLGGQRGADDVVFDLVIIDEASKATAPELLIPMSRGQRFVLVGDDKQLPPYIENDAIDAKQLAERGLTEDEIRRPTFTLLAEQLDESNVVKLTHQHRMHPSIGHLISACFYDDELTSEDREGLAWLSMLAPTPVTWLTTTPYRDRQEREVGFSFKNDLETQVVATFLNTANGLAHAARANVKVAVLAGYAAQRDALESRLGRDSARWRNLAIECQTVDAYQGRQADVVLYSVTRSNSERKLGFVRERPRVNVALSRAQDAVVIVGDHAFVQAAQGAAAMKRVLAHIQNFPKECTLTKARRA